MDGIAVFREWRWDLIGSVAAALAGWIWSVTVFMLERREDRKWKQVEFLLDANQKFFDNAEIRRCVLTMEDSSRNAELERIFLGDRALLSLDDINLREDFRRLFQFFDNLAHCVRMGVLTMDQVNLFGAYLQGIYHSPPLRKYCERHGFGEVVDLAGKVERHAYAAR